MVANVLNQDLPRSQEAAVVGQRRSVPHGSNRAREVSQRAGEKDVASVEDEAVLWRMERLRKEEEGLAEEAVRKREEADKEREKLLMQEEQRKVSCGMS